MKHKPYLYIIFISGALIRIIYWWYTIPGTGAFTICWGLFFIELIFSLLFILSSYILGKTIFGKEGGLITAGLISFAPAILIKQAALPACPYNIILFLGSILFLLSVKIKKWAIIILSFFAGSFVFWSSFPAFKKRPIDELLEHRIKDILCLQLNNMLEIKILAVIYIIAFLYLCFKLNGRLFKAKEASILIFIIFGVAITSKIYIRPLVLLYVGFPFVVAFFLLNIRKKFGSAFFMVFLFIVSLQLGDTVISMVSEREINNFKNKSLKQLMSWLAEENINYVLPLDDACAFMLNLKYVCKDYKKKINDMYVLFYSFIKPLVRQFKIEPKRWNAQSNYNNSETKYAFDGDVNTRWSSNTVQATDMFFQLDIGRQIVLDKIILYLGKDIFDKARSLEIEVSRDNEKWKRIVYLADNSNTLFWEGQHLVWDNKGDRQEYYFKPVRARYIRFKQFGFSRDKYWSIHELEIFSSNMVK